MPRRLSESPPPARLAETESATARIAAPVAAELERVDAFLAGVWEEAPNPALSQLVRHILAAGGKKLRPLLALLSAGVRSAADERAVRVAAAIEILHAATLIHDDVIDHAYVRRGIPTANSIWSNSLAVLTGDYLFAKCSYVIAELDSPVLDRMLARTVMRMVASETMQLSDLEQTAALEAEYYRKIKGKTASLLELCCEAGGLVGGAGAREQRALRAYGENLGIAFQIVDDILDIAGSEEELGKPVGGDLREGTLTLPIILFLRQAPGHAAVRALLNQEVVEGKAAWEGGEGVSEDEVGVSEDEVAVSEDEVAVWEDESAVWEAVAAIRASGAIEGAYAKAWQFAEEARAALNVLPDSASRSSLNLLIDYVVRRRT